MIDLVQHFLQVELSQENIQPRNSVLKLRVSQLFACTFFTVLVVLGNYSLHIYAAHEGVSELTG